MKIEYKTFHTDPDEIEELIVHKDKICEVKKWLSYKIHKDDDRKCLLISGPTGCGKATTLRLICDELDVDIIEFELDQKFNVHEKSDGDIEIYKISQVACFRNFILEAQSNTIETRSRTRRLLLVKELPSVFISDSKAFFEFMREIVPLLKAFLVFSIATINGNYDLSIYRLFPDSILTQLGIEHIKFNPIPKTVMKKKVTEWVSKLGTAKNANFVQLIVDKANGDLRSAMSLLEMCCVKKRLVDMKSLSSNNNGLHLFSLLGKILYAKRLPEMDEKWMSTESKLHKNVKKEYRRNLPPKEDLNELAQSSMLRFSTLSDYIIEHEPFLCDDRKALSRIYEDICQISYLTNEFAIKIDPVVNEMSRMVIIRSVAFNNFGKMKTNKGMYMFNKPSFNESQQKCASLMSELNSVYPTDSLVDTTALNKNNR